jgi:hypothetical protein
MLRNALLCVCLVLASVAAQAQELIRFTKGPNSAWSVGDKSQLYTTSDGKLAIQMVVRSSTNSGKMYYVVGFGSRTGRTEAFGARVSDKEPSKTHFTGRAEPGKVYSWGEHLPANLNTVWVLYRPSKD